MSQIKKETLKAIEHEYSIWTSFLNTSIGIVGIGLAIGSSTTSYPAVWAIISLIALYSVKKTKIHLFPPTLKKLREAELDDIDKCTLDGIEKKFFSTKAAFKHTPALGIGTISLCSVIFMGVYRIL